jgi:hypothetical protein
VFLEGKKTAKQYKRRLAEWAQPPGQRGLTAMSTAAVMMAYWEKRDSTMGKRTLLLMLSETAYTGKMGEKIKSRGEGQLTWEKRALASPAFWAGRHHQTGKGHFLSPGFRDQTLWCFGKAPPSRISFYDGAGNLIKTREDGEDGACFLAKIEGERKDRKTERREIHKEKTPSSTLLSHLLSTQHISYYLRPD